MKTPSAMSRRQFIAGPRWADPPSCPAFWCCPGTGFEEYAKLTDTTYFHDDDSLYVNLYIDSQLE
jgi:DUF1680 family protein